MKVVLIAGARGVVGRHLIDTLSSKYTIKVLSRSSLSVPSTDESVVWNPRAHAERDEKELNRLSSVMSSVDAVVNLAGASIGEGRLDSVHKDLVLASRVESTQTIVEAIQRAKKAPRVMFQASGVGYYGDRGDDLLDETAVRQEGPFLSEVSQQWEDAAKAVEPSSRLVVGRIGVVLAKDAEAWQKMVLPIKLGVGGPMGSGQQYYPWIDGDDLGRAIQFLIETEEASGTFNLTAPTPCRQIELVQAAAERLWRPSFFPTPAFLLKALLGPQVAQELLLSSSRVIPKRLEEFGFAFQNKTISDEVQKLL